MTQKQHDKHRLEKNKKPVSDSLPVGWNGGPTALKSVANWVELKKQSLGDGGRKNEPGRN